MAQFHSSISIPGYETRITVSQTSMGERIKLGVQLSMSGETRGSSDSQSEAVCAGAVEIHDKIL
jgi:hypothetical protein